MPSFPRAWAGSRHRRPLTLLLVAFVVSRTAAWSAGVRFDASPLPTFWQYVDPELLRTHLLQSLWYLHAQPPLFNLLLGLGLKTFGMSSFASAAQTAQLVVGLVLMVSLYVVLDALGLPAVGAAGLTALFVVSPAALLFESWLFYEYLVAALLVVAVVAFVRFERRPSALRSLAVFGTLAAVCYIRASFQVVALLLVLALMLAAFREHRRAVLLGAVLPVALVAALSVKNWVQVGTASTSSWVGMNLAQVDEAGLRPEKRLELERQGVIGRIWSVRTFQALDQYTGYVKVPARTGVPVLDERRKPHGPPNFNNLEYVSISRQFFHGYVGILMHAPGVYARGIWAGLKLAATPSPDYFLVLDNRAKIEPWVRGYDAAVLWQPHVTSAGGRPGGTAWGIVAGYVAALVFGAVELVRLLRRRGGSAILAFVWVVLAYTTLVMTLGEAVENQRVRFAGDPLATILVGALLARAFAFASVRVRARRGAPAESPVPATMR